MMRYWGYRWFLRLRGYRTFAWKNSNSNTHLAIRAPHLPSWLTDDPDWVEEYPRITPSP